MASSCKKCEVRHKTILECPDCLSYRTTTEHSASKELRTASELIRSLREEKHSLKGALQSALTKNDELYDKVLTSSHSFKEEARRRKAAEEELRKAKADVSILDKQFAEAKAKLDSRDQEVSRLQHIVELTSRDGNKTGLEATNRALKAQVAELERRLDPRLQITCQTQRKIAKYCSFITSKLAELPDYLALFKGRFKRPEQFTTVEDEQDVLKVMQFLADLLMFEAQTPKARSEDSDSEDDPDLYLQEATSWQFRSINKSIQTQAEKATNTSDITSPRPSVTYGGLSQIISRGDAKKTPILGRGDSFSYLYKQPFEVPKAALKDNFFKETSYSSNLSDTNGLIEVLSFQNEKLNKLNQQIAETMASSRSLLNTSKAADFRARSAASTFQANEADMFDNESAPTERRLGKVQSERELAVPKAAEVKELEEPAANQGNKTTTTAKLPYMKASKLPKPLAIQKALDHKPKATELELPSKAEFLQSPKATRPSKVASKPYLQSHK